MVKKYKNQQGSKAHMAIESFDGRNQVLGLDSEYKVLS